MKKSESDVPDDPHLRYFSGAVSIYASKNRSSARYKRSTALSERQMYISSGILQVIF